MPTSDYEIGALLLDIEGTTTPIDYVYSVLFPYARAHVKEFLAEHHSSEEARAAIAGLRDEHREDVRRGLNPPPLRDDSEGAMLNSVAAYINWLMDEDRKATPLKAIQGMIWRRGYERGELRSQVFSDVPAAFQTWHRQGKSIYIFSSGSVLAQRLLFSHTEAGDLTRFISGYFDTTIGAKARPESYRRIAEGLKRPARAIAFISDVAAELNAAEQAGMQAILVVRPGNRPQPEAARRVISSFSEMLA